jgi:hypothetical protein
MADPDALGELAAVDNLPPDLLVPSRARITIGGPRSDDVAATDYRPDAFEAAAERARARYPNVPLAVMPEAATEGPLQAATAFGRGLAAAPGNVGRVAETAMGRLADPGFYATQPPPDVTPGGIQAPPYVAPGQGSTAARVGGTIIGAPLKATIDRVMLPGKAISGEFNPFTQDTEAADWAAETAMGMIARGVSGGAPAGSLGATGGRMVQPTFEAPGGVMGSLAAPRILPRQSPTADDIAAIKAAAVQYGRKGWPDAPNGVFATTPEAYAETKLLVPQFSIKDRLPGPLPGEELPNKGRAGFIINNTGLISDRIAERLAPLVAADDPLLKFYHTGPVIRGLERHGGLSLPEANTFMRDWAGQGAATSPRTQTPPNLRNSSFLRYERARGDPLTPARYDAEGNTPGFPLMGMHVDLADAFARGLENPWRNPKPTVFRENWSGNLPDVTGDTHNIRSTLYEADQVMPGQLPAGFFTSAKAYQKYRNEGFGAIGPGDILDKLGSTTVNKIKRQSEYLPMVEPWYQAAHKLGIDPAAAQSGGWFSYGPITGLQSPPKSIPQLLNDQIGATAKTLNVPPEKIVDWWAHGKIPLAGIAGGAAMGSLAQSNDYRQ